MSWNLLQPKKIKTCIIILKKKKPRKCKIFEIIQTNKKYNINSKKELLMLMKCLEN